MANDRVKRIDRLSILAVCVAVVSAASVFVLATNVFGYHSSNHDEGVYLLQASMLLDGQLELYADGLVGAVRPWFFVEDGGRLYPKYAPVPAAMYAVSMGLFGEPRVTLAAVAAGNSALIFLLGATIADRRVGVVAAVLFAASPLALVTTSVFLPYAPTTFLNLLFAVTYLRGVRNESTLLAAIAGIAIGLAFFARPFTAVLFASPFVLHAAFRVGSSIRTEGLLPVPEPVGRHGLTACFGLLFVGVALAYNLRITGSALTFPYEAFAPMDGPGFGRREILGHSIDYTPVVALEANGYVLWYFATRWFTAGPIGTALAGGGVALAFRRWRRGADVLDSTIGPSPSFDRTAGVLLGSLFVTVPVGNVLFWGNANILATPTDPTDGFISQFGPFYHFDLLAPLSLFAAIALVACWQLVPTARSTFERRSSSRTATTLGIGALVAIVLLIGLANVAVVSAPLERNAAYGDKYERAYEPIEGASFDDALVFIPTPYGDWQNHPFQYLRNDPGFDGPVVYALDRDPGDDFAVLDAYPNRTSYRYTYRGEWTSNAYRHVVPKLEPLTVRRGVALEGQTIVGVPERVSRASVRLETESESGERTHAGYSVRDPGESLAVTWWMDNEAARLHGAELDSSVGLGGIDAVIVTVTLVDLDGSTLTYRQEATVRTGPDGVEIVWPPERYVCPLVTDCGTEGTYLPDDPNAHFDDVSFETQIASRDGKDGRSTDTSSSLRDSS